MPDAFPALADLLAEEEQLSFTSFTNDDAWELGCSLVAAGRDRHAPVAIRVVRNGQQLFAAALTGATPDNDSWIRRKEAVVARFGHSSLAVRQSFVESGTTFEASAGLDPQRYAAHGGCFPVIVRSVGPVGTVTVSGLPQVEDHRMVVAALRAHLDAR
jgi:uncharacterized protein (UPF0303 family)